MVGASLRRIRLGAQRSLRALARRAEYSPSQLSRVEREVAPPPPPSHRIYAAAAELGADLGELEAAARIERACLVDGVSWRRR
jgi:transcriptional regulator with XRE-family HTH domain